LTSETNAMKKYSANKHHELSELNITPLLDLAFVLLVIFILTTAPPVTDMDIALPSAATVNPKDAARQAQYVTINNMGKVSLNAVEMTEDQLLNTLVEIRKEDPDVNVVLRADSAIDYQRVVNVLDVLIAANVTKVGLATETAKAPN
jgi:biopolymer transport protein ExbD